MWKFFTDISVHFFSAVSSVLLLNCFLLCLLLSSLALLLLLLLLLLNGNGLLLLSRGLLRFWETDIQHTVSVIGSDLVLSHTFWDSKGTDKLAVRAFRASNNKKNVEKFQEKRKAPCQGRRKNWWWYKWKERKKNLRESKLEKRMYKSEHHARYRTCKSLLVLSSPLFSPHLLSAFHYSVQCWYPLSSLLAAQLEWRSPKQRRNEPKRIETKPHKIRTKQKN